MSRNATHPRAATTWGALVLVFVLAAGLRLVYLYQTASSPLFQTFQTDAQWHADWARAVAAGELTDHRPFFRAPLYPFFLAAAYKITGDSFTGARIIQHLLGALSCVLVCLIGRRGFSPTIGLLAGLICACYGPLIYFENELLIPSLAVFLFLLAVLVLSHAAEKPTTLRWLAGGVLLGLCAITRPSFLMLAPVIGLWWALSQSRVRPAGQLLRHTLLFGAGLVLPILPITLHNRICGNDWVLISSQGGINFFIGNHALSDGKTAVAYVPDVWTQRQEYVDNVRLTSKLHAEREVGVPLRDSQVSRFWFGVSLGFWRESPGPALALTFRKAYYFLNGFEIESNRSIYLDRLWSPLAGVLIWFHEYGLAFPLGLVFPLALVGMLRPLRDRPLANLLRLLIVVYALSVVAFFVTGRFRMPVIPLLIIFAARAICDIYGCIRQRQYEHLAFLGLVVLSLLIFCNSRLFNVRDVQYDRQASIIGTAYGRVGKPETALAYFRAAVEANPDNFAARLKLADTRFLLGHYAPAEDAYRRVLEMVPHMSTAYTGLAAALAEQSRPQAAIAALQRSLELDPNQGGAHALLAELLLDKGDVRQAREHLHRAQALGFRPSPELMTKFDAALPDSPP